MIRAKVVGKKLVKEGPFGTLVYTIKQMKVSDIITGPGEIWGVCQKNPGQGRSNKWLELECVFAPCRILSQLQGLPRQQKDMVATCSKAGTGRVRNSHRSLLGS